MASGGLRSAFLSLETKARSGLQCTNLLLSPPFAILCIGYSAFLSSFGSPTFFNISFAFSNFFGNRTLSLKKSRDLSTNTTGFFFVLMSFNPIVNYLLVLQEMLHIQHLLEILPIHFQAHRRFQNPLLFHQDNL